MGDSVTIYAKRLNPAQRKALEAYESVCGFEPMGQDDLDAGQITFAELWRTNVSWLEQVMATVQNIDTRGTGA